MVVRLGAKKRPRTLSSSPSRKKKGGKGIGRGGGKEHAVRSLSLATEEGGKGRKKCKDTGVPSSAPS